MTNAKPLFPSYTRLEHFADVCVHVASLLFAGTATVILLVAAIGTLPAADIAGLIVYCIGLMGMFAASAAYNLVSRRDLKEVLRRLDHAAIFIMIAGSYTPFALVVGGGAGRAMLAAVWAIAVIGVAIKLRFPRRLDKLSVLLYLAQGWIVILALEPVAASLPSHALWLLLAGGILYTLGVPFHLMEWMRFHNVIWHIFVLGGAACQFVAIKGAVIQS
ncbi:MAG: PAQR family membrane homeostasis protein TrhA [Rhodomicrobium sp.]